MDDNSNNQNNQLIVVEVLNIFPKWRSTSKIERERGNGACHVNTY